MYLFQAVTGVTPEQVASQEWNAARMAFYQAQEDFNRAAPEYIDQAIFALNAAERRMDNALREYKKFTQAGVS